MRTLVAQSKHTVKTVLLGLSVLAGLLLTSSLPVMAAASCDGTSQAPVSCYQTDGSQAPPYFCGGTNGQYDSKRSVHTSIDFGCRHNGNAILDMTFAIIRFLSIGVGLVVIGSIVVAGIQYTASRGDPSATAKALSRIYATVGALLLYIFAYALLNWLIPAGLLK